MAESTLKKIDEAYYSGYYIAKAQRDVARQFNMAGFFPVNYVDQKQFTVTDQWKGEEIEEQVKGRKKKLTAKGTSLRKVRFSTVTPEGMKLEKYGIELDIEIRDLLEKNITVNEAMRPITRYLASEIDRNVYEAAIAAATDKSTEYGLTNNWSDKEITDILKDMIILHNKKEAEGFNIRNVMLGMDALTELQIKAGVQGMEYTFPRNGFSLENAVEFAGMTFTWGGHDMDGKELLAFQADLPALELFYMKFRNPNVQKVPSIGLYEKFAPAINVLKYDNQKTEEEPVMTFKFATGVGTYAPEKGERLVKVPNVLDA